ncbi:leucine-rich repeat transmembrane neuronal protein 3-like [Branchiostoma floridae]|uniref:Leucine-rich repeat transmembrane neuronal protein 3-like n=1 Tax=Branchiostoma floridae TaxID=7739 RepID=A0A9J7MF30_BRAFL|nr:leucine-rich repeat transmembrane neuronal protein 3-like [Branchiostoma floridae]XP_035700058.1 leucine-rich repeat transmembrane neuronal protein 3-like [Branchiostoma floridae]
MSNKARRMLVLLLIILKEAGPTAACSSSCSSFCDCSSRGLTSVPQDLPTNITWLDLQYNAITNISQSDFLRYKSLTRLDLGSNQISMIQNKTFHNLTSLTHLYLNFNHLTSLTPDTFVGLGDLEYLHLGHNQVTTRGLPAGIFVGLSNLQYLYLNNQNQLTSLPPGIFAELANLQRLYLYQNQLTTLPAGIFSGLGNLWLLSLNSNQLTNLPADIFSGLGNLETLSLNSNQLTNLPADIFSGLGNLETLYLNSNQLTNLTADIFAGLGNLQYLRLSQNKLSTLPADIFVGLGNMQRLELSHNQLQILSPVAYDILGSIDVRSDHSFHTVIIENNPWQCDCRMLPFRQRMSGSYPFEAKIRCAGPGNFTGQYLRDVSPEDLICEETTPVHSTSTTKRIVDSNLSLSIDDSSSPFPQSAKAPTLLLTLPTNAPAVDTNPGLSTASTDFAFGFQSTKTDSNAGPTGNGIFLSLPLLATLCVFLGLFIISTIALTLWCMYKRNTGTSTGNNQMRMHSLTTDANVNSQFETSQSATEDSQLIPRFLIDDPEYKTIGEISQSNRQHQGTGNTQSLDRLCHSVLPPPLPPENPTGPQADAHSESGDADGDTWTDEMEYDDVLSSSQRPQLGSEQMQHHDDYEFPSPSLCPENGAQSQAKEGPQFQLIFPPLLTPEARSESADAAARKVGGGDTRTDEEYNDVLSQSQRPQAKDKTRQTQHLSSFSDDYEVPSPSLGPENGAYPQAQARAEPQPHEYENNQVIAAAKDAESCSQVTVNENDDNSVFNQPQTASAPGADSPNHYEPLRNPSGQQQHDCTSLLPRDLQH